jgi:hypothetical protein
MSEFSFYPDNCVLKRATGTVDIHGDEVFEILYEGECGLQFPSGGATSLQGGILQSYPALVIPATDILLKQNDTILITMDYGRELRGTVEQYDVVAYDNELNGATIWLDSVIDVEEK